MYKQIAAVTIALVLSLGIIGTAYAQGSNATGIQIQVVPEIQRGHNQHLTLFAVDDDGNQVNETITSQITNEKGNPVGPGTVESESGDVLTYKVGPNTRPQNITVSAQLEDGSVSAEQSYYVFPKGQAQQPTPDNDNDTQPVPFPPQNDTETPPVLTPPGQPPILTNQTDNDTQIPEVNNTGGNETVPSSGNETGPVVIEQPTNQTQVPTNETSPENGGTGNQTNNQTNTGGEQQEQPAGLNATQVFNNLANQTAILDEAVNQAEGDANETQRADIKALIDGQSDAIGQTSGLTVNATEEQLTVLEGAFAAGQDATNQVFDDGDGDD